MTIDKGQHDGGLARAGKAYDVTVAMQHTHGPLVASFLRGDRTHISLEVSER